MKSKEQTKYIVLLPQSILLFSHLCPSDFESQIYRHLFHILDEVIYHIFLHNLESVIDVQIAWMYYQCKP